jgi:hypothetical protein
MSLMMGSLMFLGILLLRKGGRDNESVLLFSDVFHEMG